MPKKKTPEITPDMLHEMLSQFDANQMQDSALMDEFEIIVIALKNLYEQEQDESRKKDIAFIARRYETLCWGLSYVLNRKYMPKEEHSEFQ